MAEQDRRNLSPAGRRMVAASLPENRAARAETGRVLVADLMGSEDLEPGLERGDGFFVAHVVAVTEPWAPSRTDRGERPRVRPATRNRVCAEPSCRFEFQGTTQTRFCGGPDCNRARAARRARKHRATVTKRSTP